MDVAKYPFKISVIVPVYNVARYLEKGILSLFQQTLDGIEYLFVDDHSTDGSYEVLQDILTKYPAYKDCIQLVRHEQNRGVATARNTGLSLARGKYLAAMDPDDWVNVNMFGMMYAKAEETGANIVWCDYYNTYLGHQEYISQQTTEVPYSCIDAMLRGQIMGGMCNKLILRVLFTDNNIRFPDGLNMIEDLSVCVQLFYYAKRVAHIKQAFYHYVKHREDSISVRSTLAPKINREWIANVKAIELFLADKGGNELRESVQLLKLFPKQNLLVRGNSMSHLRQWREIFPESNIYVWKSDLPFHYKLIASCIDKNQWALPHLWLAIKRLKQFIS